ncbi:MAG TPA: MaoC family dehydratase, partial [Microbacteriaceae bacterium]|nr:MaoC family dehydratase [Microbacteriaceae bacterium]
LHLDAAFAATQPFGRPLINSMWTLSTMVGASVAQLTQGTLVAQLGMGEISFPHPLFAGDTLYTETTPLTARLSASRPGQGIVVLAHTGRNQRGEVVARASRTALVWCIGRGGAST